MRSAVTKRRRVVEVELDLPVAALVVEAERTEAAFAHGLDHRTEEFHDVERRLHVVGGGRAEAAGRPERDQVLVRRIPALR